MPQPDQAAIQSSSSDEHVRAIRAPSVAFDEWNVWYHTRSRGPGALDFAIGPVDLGRVYRDCVRERKRYRSADERAKERKKSQMQAASRG